MQAGGFLYPQIKSPDALTERQTHMQEATFAIRVNRENLDHHLWNNHGTWWCHLTLHLPDYTKRRLRLSLGTRDLFAARRLRNALLALFGCPFQPIAQETA
jgi:hypothetical protein